MAADKKFGTFSGVFTPSILTILGVIMYLRLPWVVGQAGLWTALGIVAVAHIISVCTGLSISSIATDKSVGAGGPYYIVSRSLGLPIGGTLGLALFVGLSFSISLYIIGFSTSFLSYWGLPTELNSVRLCGTIVLIVLTVITLISTALAIKTQYVILGLISLSLVVIPLGSGVSAPAGGPLLTPLEGGESAAALFAIFFPAVTGFTAGVNMSGDLKDPRKSIPGGTMAAIGTGFLVYVSLTVFLAFKVNRQSLVEDPDVLVHFAAWGPGVVAGIWGATLSSALGSILGAPRILQALSSDRITPKVFAKGTGKTNEPRNALILAFVLGEAGILIGELDVIARVVSMVFLATYGFLNLSAAIESWASPDFRPDFRIPVWVSVLGALVSLLVMIQLDLLAMAGATLLMVGIFLFLQRRELQLESGDTWEGIWASVVRLGLSHLRAGRRVERNWRPNVLCFSHGSSEARGPLLSFGTTLVSGRGILTDLVMPDGAGGAANEPGHHGDVGGEVDLPAGVFRRELPAGDDVGTIEAACRFHGFAGLEPNSVLMDWLVLGDHPERFEGLLDTLEELDLNVLLYAHEHDVGLGAQERVDVWWRAGEGNLPLSVALVRFLTSTRGWGGARVRVMLFSEESADNDQLASTARRFLAEARVDAPVRVLNPAPGQHFDELMRAESSDADLVLVPVPRRGGEATVVERMQALNKALNTVLYVRASSSFRTLLHVRERDDARADRSAQHQLGDVILDVPPLVLPDHPAIADAARAYAGRIDEWSGELTDSLIARFHEHEAELLANLTEITDRHFGLLEKGVGGANNPKKRRNAVNRVQSAFLMQARKAIDDYEGAQLATQHAVLEQRLEQLLDREDLVERGGALEVGRPREVFRISRGDPRHRRRFKRRTVRRAWWGRLSQPSYALDLERLQEHYHGRLVGDLLVDGLKVSRAQSHRLLVTLGDLLMAAETSLSLIGEDRGPEELARFVSDQRARAAERLEELRNEHSGLVRALRRELQIKAREVTQAYADDLDSIDAVRVIRRERKAKGALGRAQATRSELPAQWLRTQHLLLGRARLGLQISGFQHRLASTAFRLRDAVRLDLRNGVLGSVEKLLGEIEGALAKLEEGELPVVRGGGDFDKRIDVAARVEALDRDTGSSAEELPEVFLTLDDRDLDAIANGELEEPSPVEVPVRRLVQFRLESRLVGPLQEALARMPPVEGRVASTAQDVVRLITFNRAEHEIAEGDEPGAEVLAQVRPVLQDGLERVREGFEELRALGPDLDATLDRQLTDLIDATSPHALVAGSSQLGQRLRYEKGLRAFSGLFRRLGRGRDRVRDFAVGLIYRHSDGVLLARRLEQGRAGGLVDRVLAYVSSHSPRAEVLKALPFFYKQLFTGSSPVHHSFWYGREAELARARHAVTLHRRGTPGAIIITGDRGAGKSAFVHRMVGSSLSSHRVFRVAPRRGGSTNVADFDHAMHAALQGEAGSSIFDSLAGLPDRTVIVIRDLELWWERSSAGLEVIDRILGVIDAYGDRILFVVEVGRQALDVLERLRGVEDRALAVVECGPLPAEALKEIVMLRHASTGLRFAVRGRGEDEIGALRQARLFSSYFDYSLGNVGAALGAWITHIDEVDGKQLEMRVPVAPTVDVLEELRPPFVALLVQLVLHKQLTHVRLIGLTGLDPGELEHQLSALMRMGLVTESSEGVLALESHVQHLVVEALRRQEVLR